MITRLFVGAAVTAASVLGMPSANAADSYVALSVGLLNDAPPVSTVGGMSVGPDQNQARIASLSDCQGKGGNHCVFQVIATNACAAAAANDFGEFAGATDPTLFTAQSNAKSQLSNQQGAHVVISGCTTGRPVNQVPPGLVDAPPVTATMTPSPTVGPPPGPGSPCPTIRPCHLGDLPTVQVN